MAAILWLALHRRGHSGPPLEPIGFPWMPLLAAIVAAVALTLAGLARIRFGRGEPQLAWMASMAFTGELGYMLASMAKRAKERAE